MSYFNTKLFTFRNALILATFSLISFPILAQPPGYSLCSAENELCIFDGFPGFHGVSVAYGANGSFVFQNKYLFIRCNNGTFGVDPAPGIVKACYVPTDPPGYIPWATQGKSCALSNTKTVAFGANGQFTSWPQFTGKDVLCNYRSFPGADPAPGVAENCFIPAPPPNYDFCSVEGATCSLVSALGLTDEEVAFGGDGNFVFRNFTGDPTAISCTPSAFFGVDPAPGAPEACFKLGWSPLFPAPLYGYSLCSAENGFCNFSNRLNVAYGANGNFVFQNSALNGMACNTANITGDVDPAPGTVKACYIPTVPPGFTQCSNENGACYFLGTGAAPVAYGANGKFVFKSLTSGFGCNNGVFGRPSARNG
jgi:hypothetical protein